MPCEPVAACKKTESACACCPRQPGRPNAEYSLRIADEGKPKSYYVAGFQKQGGSRGVFGVLSRGTKTSPRQGLRRGSHSQSQQQVCPRPVYSSPIKEAQCRTVQPQSIPKESFGVLEFLPCRVGMFEVKHLFLTCPPWAQQAGPAASEAHFGALHSGVDRARRRIPGEEKS